jgi:hypothetical protein
MDKIEQTIETNVPFILHINRSGLNVKLVQQSDNVNGSFGQVYKDNKTSPEIQQNMHIYTTFTFSESRPWAQFQAHAYSTVIKGISQIVNVKPETIISLIHWMSNIYKHTDKISVYSLVAKFAGYCKSVSCNNVPYTTLVKIIGNCNQTISNILEAVSLGELSETHNKEMIPVCEIANPMVPFVPVNIFIGFIFWYHRHKPCKNYFSLIHGDFLYDLATKVNFKS